MRHRATAARARDSRAGLVPSRTISGGDVFSVVPRKALGNKAVMPHWPDVVGA